MSVQTIYGFIIDQTFHNTLPIDLNQQVDTGLGYLNDNLINYFHKKSILNDTRTSRLNILGSASTLPIQILFDKSKVDNIDVIGNLSSQELFKIFNIVERILYSDTNTIPQLESHLTSEIEFDLYVPNSVSWSVGVTNATITIGNASLDILIRDSFNFEINLGTSQIIFKLWVKESKFALEYPLSTITKVIPPAPPASLLDVSQFTDVISTMISSIDFSFSRLDPEIKNDDHSGLLQYYTKYVIASNNTRLVPFGILYKGAKPTSLEIRKAIRDYFTSLGIANEEVWKTIFPDIYIIAEFYLVPIWTNKINRIEREIYPSILATNRVTWPLEVLFPDIDISWVEQKTELVMNAKLELFTLSLPDPLNASDYTSLLTIHPTYQNHGSDHSTFGFMEEHTQDFGRRFAKAISILSGESFMTDEFIENTFNNREFISFAVFGVEYHVLKENQFPAMP